MKRRSDVSAMLRLKARGWGLRRIAAKLRCSRTTVRRWLAQGEWRPHPSRSRPAKLDGLSDWLRERFCLHAGNTNAVRQELAREKNITASLRTVERAVAPLWREWSVRGRPPSNGCDPSFRKTSTLMRCAAKLAMSPTSRPCFSACMKGVYLTGTGRWSSSLIGAE